LFFFVYATQDTKKEEEKEPRKVFKRKKNCRQSGISPAIALCNALNTFIAFTLRVSRTARGASHETVDEMETASTRTRSPDPSCSCSRSPRCSSTPISEFPFFTSVANENFCTLLLLLRGRILLLHMTHDVAVLHRTSLHCHDPLSIPVVELEERDCQFAHIPGNRTTHYQYLHPVQPTPSPMQKACFNL
jgi:hypothetical protein